MRHFAMLMTASMPDVMRLTAFVLLILASGCEAKPGAGFFAVAGLAIPGVGGMAPGGDGVPALPEAWRMPTAPQVPLGMMPGVDGAAHADAIPRTIIDGLGLSLDEHLVWAQPLVMVSVAMEGFLGTACSTCDLGMDLGGNAGLAPMKMTWTLCQCALSAVLGLRTQCLKFLLNSSFACLAGIGSITWVCNQFNLHEHGFRLMPMTLTLTMESAAAWWAHPLGMALNRMRNVLRPLVPRMIPAAIESLQARGIAWLRYHDDMKRVRDIAEELAIEEERDAVIRELHRRRAVRDAAANAPAHAAPPAPAAGLQVGQDWA